MPADMAHQYRYSNRADPVGRLFDLPAAETFDDARAIQRDACATWHAKRRDLPLTGKFGFEHSNQPRSAVRSPLIRFGAIKSCHQRTLAAADVVIAGCRRDNDIGRR